MTAGLTWARNEVDDEKLSLKELSDNVLKLKQEPTLKRLKISRATLLCFPQMPMANPVDSNPQSMLGVPIEIDDSISRSLSACRFTFEASDARLR